MKDRLKIWFIFPIMILLFLYINYDLNYQIIDLNKRIINFIPSKNTCLGCCTLDCLKQILNKTIKLKMIFPYFSVIMLFISIIAIIILTHSEIKKENNINNEL